MFLFYLLVFALFLTMTRAALDLALSKGGGTSRVSYIFGPKILNSVLLILKMVIEG